jgi:photosystem II stability/assembly factor-like uncharacterized protein
VGSNGTILKTVDGGENWVLQNSGEVSDFWSANFIDEQTGWTVGSNGTILKTVDGGENWVLQNSGTINQLRSVYFANDQTGWIVGSRGTILNTIDGGEHWISQGRVTTNDLLSAKFIDTQTGWIVGYGGTILHTTNGGVTFIEDEENNSSQPKEFLLQQNYPNPFNPSTKISWQSPVGSWQTLKVYDVLGNEVATLVNEYREAGSYEVDFQSSAGSHQLANGVYFYQLRVGDLAETKKMILLK